MGASKWKEGVERERKYGGCVSAVEDEQTARGGAGMEEIAEVRGKLSQNCIHCACTISRSRRERMREGEREAGKMPDFSCRSPSRLNLRARSVGKPSGTLSCALRISTTYD